ncbi:MAG: CDP-diacylglycerol--serine O-phosphatidyltransferase [Planctomycetota bacterium]|jgi:CDP-diacylglycerol--serine O-phosphatidyltransferase
MHYFGGLVKRISLLPNLVTLANATCGLLAISKAIDALAVSDLGPVIFYAKMHTACSLIFLAMVFDAMDGKLARMTKTASEFGAQLDSFSDLITFGVAPALIAKVLIEHEGLALGYTGSPRLHFMAAAAFALMALLRLARFNLETDTEESSHTEFSGLPSPAAAGALISTIWLYLILRRPELEVNEGTRTPLGHLMGWMEDIDWMPMLTFLPVVLTTLLIVLGLLMVSRVRYSHLVSNLTGERSQFVTLVMIVFVLFLLFLAPVPALFLIFNGFWIYGIYGAVMNRRRSVAAAADAKRS